MLSEFPLSEAAVKPIKNSYWVRPGRLLAGEYPLGRHEEESAVRLQDLLLAGVNCFINLTEERELPGYHNRLPSRFAGKPVVHHRFAIPDHGVPQAQQMTAILDVIDAALAVGSCVYVHCRAGIGRTGTVMGCHLVRHGYLGPAALELLNQHWQACARAASWPTIPETEAQENFVRSFKEAAVTRPVPAAEHGKAGIYQGALLGLALGDVLGRTGAAQVSAAAAGWNDSSGNLSGLHWGGDTAMSLALADSLLSCKQMQPEDQMQRYLAWHKQGRYSSNDQPGQAPPAVQKALGQWQWKRNPLAGSHDPALIDAHPLARCAPVALYFADQPVVAMQAAAESARTSAQAPLTLDACRVFTALLLALVEGVPLPQWAMVREGRAFTELRTLPLKPELLDLIDGGWRVALTQASGEDVLSVLASAMHAVATTHNFQSALFKSMQRAAQPATVGAVCGALAGALYGVHGLPIIWRETLPRADDLLRISERLLIAAME